MIIQGIISLLWIQECLNSKNQNKTVQQLRNEFALKTENVNLLNPGTLFMATYLMFLYPKESEIKNANLDEIKLPDYKVLKAGKVKENSKTNFLRRIRNSIAHANFEITNNLDIIFRDINPKDITDKFEIEIQLYKFGEFINSFMLTLKNQYFKRNA
jgi:hypothetical protein